MGNRFSILPDETDYIKELTGGLTPDGSPPARVSLAKKVSGALKSLVRPTAVYEQGLGADAQGNVVPVTGNAPSVPNILSHITPVRNVLQAMAQRDLEKKSLTLQANMLQQKMDADRISQAIAKAPKIIPGMSSMDSGIWQITPETGKLEQTVSPDKLRDPKVFGEYVSSVLGTIGDRDLRSRASIEVTSLMGVNKYDDAIKQLDWYRSQDIGIAEKKRAEEERFKQQDEATSFQEFGGHKYLVRSKTGEIIKDLGTSSAAFNFNLRQAGTEPEIEIAARGLVEPGNLTALKDIASLRGDQRLKIYAKARELDPTFDPGMINQRVKFLQSYEDPKGRAAINRQSINNIIQHAADLSAVNQQYRRTNVRVLNTAVNALAGQFGDTTYTNFQVPLGVIKDELSLYFAGGYAPTVDQQKMWNKIQGDSATPAQIEAFAKDVIHVGLRRASTFNSMFRKNMGVDDPNMITPDAKDAARQLGLVGEVGKFGSGGELRTGLRSLARPTQVGPKVGDVESGYRFTGGDPADRNSWQKVK